MRVACVLRSIEVHPFCFFTVGVGHYRLGVNMLLPAQFLGWSTNSGVGGETSYTTNLQSSGQGESVRLSCACVLGCMP